MENNGARIFLLYRTFISSTKFLSFVLPCIMNQSMSVHIPHNAHDFIITSMNENYTNSK